jgi:deoxyribodipyrimidine photo-lyase
MNVKRISIFWFRRDLRLNDNAGLYEALKSHHPVLPVFIFDRDILDKLEDKKDRRVEFIHDAILELQNQLVATGSTLDVRYGKPLEIFKILAETYTISAVYTNHDYENYAKSRDAQIKDFLQNKGIAFHTFKDQAVFEKNEVLSGSNTPYTVFTPYANKWKSTLNDFYLKSYPTEKYFHNFLKNTPLPVISLPEMGFVPVKQAFPDRTFREELVKNYGNTRNFPGTEGTTRLSVHLRFGTISIRALAKQAKELSETYLNELIWRDFYMNILWHFPHVEQHTFRPEYEKIQWRNDTQEFERWCEGNTGYPLVDAGMRELNATGFMHNRVRMVTASFLIKHLLIDWRWGERYFARKLLDYELASNNGGWQWAAGSGTDAAPYFRVFNPAEQVKKFDKDLVYIKKWIPELSSFDYPPPIVEHKFARERVLQVYKEALS